MWSRRITSGSNVNKTIFLYRQRFWLLISKIPLETNTNVYPNLMAVVPRFFCCFFTHPKNSCRSPPSDQISFKPNLSGQYFRLYPLLLLTCDFECDFEFLSDLEFSNLGNFTVWLLRKSRKLKFKKFPFFFFPKLNWMNKLAYEWKCEETKVIEYCNFFCITFESQKVVLIETHMHIDINSRIPVSCGIPSWSYNNSSC